MRPKFRLIELENRVTPVNYVGYTVTGAFISSVNFYDPLIWNPQGVPGPGDTASGSFYPSQLKAVVLPGGSVGGISSSLLELTAPLTLGGIGGSLTFNTSVSHAITSAGNLSIGFHNASNNDNTSTVKVTSGNLTFGGDNKGSLVVSSGSLTGNLSLTNTGTVTGNGGVLGGTVTNSAGGVITFTNSDGLSGNLTNNGTVSIGFDVGNPSAATSITNGGSFAVTAGQARTNNFTNTGTLSIASGAKFVVLTGFTATGGSLAGGGTFVLETANLTGSAVTVPAGLAFLVNSGSVSVPLTLNGPLEILNGSTFSQAVSGSGAVTVSSGTAKFTGGFTPSGTVTVAGGATLQTAGFTNSGATFAGTGTLRFLGAVGGSAVALTPGLLVQANGATFNSGVTVPAGGSFTATGAVSSVNANFGNAGTVLIEPSSGFTVAGGATFTNTAGGVIKSDGSNVTNTLTGTVVNQGSLEMLFNNRLTLSNFTNSGTVTVGDGGILKTSSGANFTQTAGVTSLNPVSFGAEIDPDGVFDLQGGTLTGRGVIRSTLQGAGTVTPGGTGTGVIQIFGNYAPSGGKLVVDLNGTTAGTAHDQIQVAGGVNLTGASLQINLGFTPAEGQKITLVTNDGGDSVTGTFNGLAEGSQSKINNLLFEITYKGGDGNDVVLTRVEPNVAPVLAAVGNKSVNEGSNLSFTATATDANIGQTLTFSLVNAPAGASITSGGAFSWTPTDGPSQTSTFTVRVTDNGNPPLSDEETITVTVTNVNPTASGITGPPSLVVGSPMTFTFQNPGDVSPADAAALAFSYDFNNDGTFEISKSTKSSESFTYAVSGNYTIKGRIHDKDGGFNDYTTTLQPNAAPTLNPIGNKIVNEGSPLSFTATASDPNVNTTLTFSLVNAPPGAAITGGGKFTWTPTDGPAQTSTFAVRVTDNGTPPLSTDETITVTVNNVAPTATGVSGPNVVTVGQPQAFTITDPADVSPEDAAALAFSFDFGNDGTFEITKVASATGIHTFTENKNYTIRGRVWDKDGGFFDTFTSISPNQPPSLNPVGNKSVSEGSLLAFTVTANDANPGTTLTYSLLGAPAGAAIDGKTGQFSWTPTDGPAQTSTFTIRVSDNGTPPLFDEETITVTVNNLNPMAAGLTGPAFVTPGLPQTFTLVGPADPSSVDAMSLTFSFDFDNDGAFEIVNSKTPGGTHTYAKSGTYTVTGRVSDKDGGFSDYTTKISPQLPSDTGEIAVNQTTLSVQNEADIAMDADGDFVVVWQSYLFTGSQFDIFARRYNADGTPLTDEFRVNTTTLNQQQFPRVAMDSAGNFAVTWQSVDGSGVNVYARRYDAAGQAITDQKLVTAVALAVNLFPCIATTETGEMFVTYAGLDGSGFGVKARRLAADGTPLGEEILVNTTTAGIQNLPDVSSDAGGDVVVTWQGEDGSGYGVYARRFDAAGVPQGGEFLVNTATLGQQKQSSVSRDDAGNFVVAWAGDFDGSSYAVYARRYNAAGVAQGGQFQVNLYTTGPQQFPSVALDADGDFTIAWQSQYQDGSSTGIYARRYRADGTGPAVETRINATTFSFQQRPAVAVDADGDVAFAWDSTYQDGNSYGVYARRMAGRAAVTGVIVNDGSPQESRVTSLTVTFSGVVTAPAAAFTLTRTGPGSPTGAVGLTVDFTGSTPTQTVAKLTFTGPLTESLSLIDGRYTLTVTANQVTDVFGQPLDGDGDTVPGGEYTTTFTRLFGDADGNGTVNFVDFLAFRSAFGTKAANSPFDFNNDGVIDFVDFLAFRARFGTSIP